MSEKVAARMEALFRKHRDEGGDWARHEYVLVARCLTGKHVLKAGYGVAGVGRMWMPLEEEDRMDELWGELPEVQCVRFAISDPCPPGPHGVSDLMLLNAQETIRAVRAESRRGRA